MPSDYLSMEQRRRIQKEIDSNIEILKSQGKMPVAKKAPVALIWPIEASHSLTDYGFHGISNFVDHDSGYPDQLLDYGCGYRTYDTNDGYNHTGTDFFSWPFGWKKMDDDKVRIVAAAEGIIVGKEDGYDDRSCQWGGNDSWNAVYVIHSDGSVAWYGHMKNGSPTDKSIGESVQAGEYLGIMGSSGISTGPHLHFELHDAEGNVIDPYGGSCGPSNSLWKS